MTDDLLDNNFAAEDDAPTAMATDDGGNGAQSGIIEPIDIEQEMRVAYLDYAMSVIVSTTTPWPPTTTPPWNRWNDA